MLAASEKEEGVKCAWVTDTPVGKLTLVQEDDALIEVRFGEKLQGETLQRTELLAQAQLELEEYFQGMRKTFTVNLAPRGTPFQHKCWNALLQIPYGQTRSYLEQAKAAGNEKACRAAGMANHRNPLPIFIPCHRVVGKNGALIGYAGGLNVKQMLLALERTKQK